MHGSNSLTRWWKITPGTKDIQETITSIGMLFNAIILTNDYCKHLSWRTTITCQRVDSEVEYWLLVLQKLEKRKKNEQCCIGETNQTSRIAYHFITSTEIKTEPAILPKASSADSLMSNFKPFCIYPTVFSSSVFFSLNTDSCLALFWSGILKKERSQRT